MSALTPTGAGAGGAYDLFNFGFGGSKNENDGPWSPDWGQQPHPPTPQTLRHLLAATASRALFEHGQGEGQDGLVPQQLQQQQQQSQQYFYSPTPPGQSCWLAILIYLHIFLFLLVFWTPGGEIHLS